MKMNTYRIEKESPKAVSQFLNQPNKDWTRKKLAIRFARQLRKELATGWTVRVWKVIWTTDPLNSTRAMALDRKVIWEQPRPKAKTEKEITVQASVSKLLRGGYKKKLVPENMETICKKNCNYHQGADYCSKRNCKAELGLSCDYYHKRLSAYEQWELKQKKEGK